jgi:acyl-CoA thioester hydrolase
MKKKPRARIHFGYEVRRGDELLATGHSSHGFMDRSGKGQRPPEDLVKLMEAAWIEAK